MRDPTMALRATNVPSRSRPRVGGLAVALALALGSSVAFGQRGGEVVTPAHSVPSQISGRLGDAVNNAVPVRSVGHSVNPAVNAGGFSATSSLFSTSFDPKLFGVGSGLKGFGSITEPRWKWGWLGFDVGVLRAELIASDNINQTEIAESGWVSRVAVDATVSLSPYENLSVKMNGRLVWLPFTGDVGIEGFGLGDGRFGDGASLYGAEGVLGVGTNLSMVWAGIINGWDVSVFNYLNNDRTQASYRASGSGSYRMFYNVLDPETFDEVDRAGRYQFGSSRSRSPSDVDQELEADYFDSSDSRTFDEPRSRISNITGTTLGKDLESVESRFELTAYNEFSWERTDDGETTHDRRQGVVTSVDSVRENLRFRPFAIAVLERQRPESSPDWRSSETYRVGVRSELTEQLTGVASVGLVRSDAGADETVTYNLSLRHVAGPYTVHSFTVDKAVANRNLVREGWNYRVSQVLGARLTGSFFVSADEYRDLVGASVGTSESIGVDFSYLLSEAIRLSMSYFHVVRQLGQPGPGRITNETHVLSFNYSHVLSETLSVNANYRYQDQATFVPGNSSIENVLFLTVTKDL